MSNDLIKRSDAIDAIELVDWYHQNRNKDMVSGADSDKHQAWYKSQDIYEALENIPSVDRPQGEWIEVSTLREIFGDVQYAHRGNSEAEAVIADVWYEVKDVLKGADDEV